MALRVVSLCVCLRGGGDSDGVDCIPSHVQRGLDVEKIVQSSVPVVSLAILMRR